MPQVFAAIWLRSLSLIAGLEKVITPPIPIPELGEAPYTACTHRIHFGDWYSYRVNIHHWANELYSK